MRISVLTTSIRPRYLDITQKTLEQQTFTDFEWLVEVGLHDGVFRLPENYNKMLRRASGDIIVSLQDCISLPQNALAQIAELSHDRVAYTYPLAKTSEPGSHIWDWRKGMERDITPNEWEIDLASAPRSLFYDIGGFDEEFKHGWGWDNVEVGWRGEAAGYTFKCSHSTEGYAIDHDQIVTHPFRNTLPLNAPRANETMEKARRGNFKLTYLY